MGLIFERCEKMENERITFQTTIGAGIYDEKGNSILPSDIYHAGPEYYKEIMRALNKLKELEDNKIN